MNYNEKTNLKCSKIFFRLVLILIFDFYVIIYIVQFNKHKMFRKALGQLFTKLYNKI